MSAIKNCTNHFLKRWVERIMGINTEKEILDYIRDNREQIVEHANKTFSYATFLYKGAIGDNLTRNFYIEDDIIFVMNTTDDAMITVYKVDLGFTPEINSTVRKGLIEEVIRLTKEKEEADFQVLVDLENKEHEVKVLDGEIEVLKQQLKNLEADREFAQEHVKNIKGKTKNLGLELKRFTMLLVNSQEYRKDLLNLK